MLRRVLAVTSRAASARVAPAVVVRTAAVATTSSSSTSTVSPLAVPARKAVTFGAASLCKPAPDFTVSAARPDGTVGPVSLSDYKGKYVVLVFYPKSFTFVCPTEIISFSDRAQEFKDIGAEVLAASVDSENVQHAWTLTERKDGGLGKLNIPVLGDVSRDLSTKYGCLLDTGFTCRATYIIDGKGVLRHANFNDPPVGRSVDETLRLVQAFQYFDKNGEVCPANWKPGQPTMKPTYKDSRAFFAANK